MNYALNVHFSPQPDRVMEFCNNNDLQLIVRAHECVMDGFERFAQGHLITLFSATNYCGKHKLFRCDSFPVFSCTWIVQLFNMVCVQERQTTQVQS